ncbi:iron-containing alcohol dehydrogenase [Aquabacterium sp. J223]|uniref:iron-containing alcohol dehydrogenase n=1 Tax=Aquabacterium sp. J223 TaxID=2898431 RepID=UPI0021ADAE4B|nr:iron-containing alcohol dehydrogenase [Aquabacterium sp. J223]UUX97675.1 iron-containing alcohol dehydrogenase [Aquabacterium sp. J223]
MNDFDFNTTRSLSVQRGGAGRLGDRLAALGATRVLVITDPGVLAAGLLQAPLAGLQAAGLAHRVFSEVEADPPEHVIEAAVQAALGAGADLVLGFGGGSAMDVAKLVALLAGSREPLAGAYGIGQARGPRLPLVLVPTTAGTGSEVTPIAIVTTGPGEKKGVVSPLLLPDLALLDAELTVGLPAPVTAATGIDAMVHAVEAYTTRRLKNPLSDCLAREALRLLAGALHRACRDGRDRAAREDMLLGASLAGMAFANAPVAAVHALAYPVGARFHVPHGLSNALMLGPVLRFNLPQAADRYAELCDIVQPGTGGDTAARAEAFVRWMGGLSAGVGLPGRLREVGIGDADLPQLAADAMLQTRLLVNNPREVTQADALALYREAW